MNLKIEKANRLVNFDLMRGYFMFVIMIDHLMRSFGFWEIFTGRGAQWVSAAEGFFFLSGVMIGMVRGRKMVNLPIVEVFRKCWRRALTLYLWGVGLSISFSLLALYLKDNIGLKGGYFEGTLGNFLLQTLTLRFSYGWADFLGFYAVYLFFAPIAILLLRKKLWHSVLLASFAVWLSTTTMMGGWQIIFFSGLVAGFHKEELEDFIRSKSARLKRVVTWIIYSTAGITLAASVFFTTIAEEYGSRAGSSLEQARNYSVGTLRPIFDKVAMEPSRIILFFIWFSALYILVLKYEQQLKNRAGWLLLILGQNSLYVYIVHAILLFFLNLLIPVGQHWAINVLINTGFVLSVWYLSKKKFLFRIIPR